MTNRVSWPQICRSAEFKGSVVALDNCRYDQSSMQPVEGTWWMRTQTLQICAGASGGTAGLVLPSSSVKARSSSSSVRPLCARGMARPSP